jgi:hypothetical protein
MAEEFKMNTVIGKDILKGEIIPWLEANQDVIFTMPPVLRGMMLGFMHMNDDDDED